MACFARDATLKRFDTSRDYSYSLGQSKPGCNNRLMNPCPGGGIGRRAGFRCQWPQGRGSSSLLLGTIYHRTSLVRYIGVRPLYRCVNERRVPGFSTALQVVGTISCMKTSVGTIYFSVGYVMLLPALSDPTWCASAIFMARKHLLGLLDHVITIVRMWMTTGMG